MAVIIEKYMINPNYRSNKISKKTISKVVLEEGISLDYKKLKETREARYMASDVYNPYQEAHSPTMDIAGKKSQHICRRRVQDVRVQDKIDDINGNVAAIRISRAYHHMVNGVSIKSASYTQTYERRGLESILSDGDWLDYLNKCVTDYKKWRDLYDKKCVNCEAILDIVYWGLSFDAVTKKYRKRNGWASDNLVAGLELYNRMEGL